METNRYTKPRERAKELLNEKLEEMHPETKIIPRRPTTTMTEHKAALIIALQKARNHLENRIIGLTSTKNRDIDVHSLIQVIKDYNQVTLAQWKLAQEDRRS